MTEKHQHWVFDHRKLKELAPRRLQWSTVRNISVSETMTALKGKCKSKNITISTPKNSRICYCWLMVVVAFMWGHFPQIRDGQKPQPFFLLLFLLYFLNCFLFLYHWSTSTQRTFTIRLCMLNVNNTTRYVMKYKLSQSQYVMKYQLH